ncbi:MAG: hypothetical protein JNM56_27065 [Planctomycetia bacterium]|nr:hypothetical protein [Planctomycetia bacterium]
MKPSSCCWARWLLPCLIAGSAAFLLLWPTAHAGPAVAYVKLDDNPMRVTGPYVHDNLAAYLIHSDKPQDERRFITLQEGLDRGWVKVTEKEQESVGELLVENQSDHYLDLQDGDLLQGGKQDRTIYATHIVPPHTKEPAKSFCVEPSRWAEGRTGRAFANPTNLALAPKEIKQAAKFQNDQQAVWANVAGQRGQISANQAYAANYVTSSFNEARESAKLKADVKRLGGPVEADVRRELGWYPDVVGIAVAVNGRVEEIAIYPNRPLLEKIFPRLLEAYAEQALLNQGAGAAQTASAREIAQFMHLDKQQQVAAASRPRTTLENRINNINNTMQGARIEEALTNDLGRPLAQPNAASQPRISFYERRVNEKNGFDVQETAGKYACTTKFEGKTVGYQFMSRNQPQPRVQPSSWRNPMGQAGGGQIIFQPQQRQTTQQIDQQLNNDRRQQPVQQNFNPVQQPQRANPPVRINEVEVPNATPAPQSNNDSREALPAPREEERLPAPRSEN